MPMYDYHCEACNSEFEQIRPMAERAVAPCDCGATAGLVIRQLARVDPNADLPGQRMIQRKAMQARGRGKDMWEGNRRVDTESIDREAWNRRKDYGEQKIVSVPKKEA